MKNIQKNIDTILAKTILRFIPHSIKPNYITTIRLILIPIILYYLSESHLKTSIILFLFATFTDALDGAMARTRHQITNFGKLYDPIVDKLLIGSVAFIIVWQYLHPSLAIMLIILELLLTLNGLYQKQVCKKIISANWSGKIKFILQSIGIFITLLYAMSNNMLLWYMAIGTLGTSICFGTISLVVYRSA